MTQETPKTQGQEVLSADIESAEKGKKYQEIQIVYDNDNNNLAFTLQSESGEKCFEVVEKDEDEGKKQIRISVSLPHDLQIAKEGEGEGEGEGEENKKGEEKEDTGIPPNLETLENILTTFLAKVNQKNGQDESQNNLSSYTPQLFIKETQDTDGNKKRSYHFRLTKKDQDYIFYINPQNGKIRLYTSTEDENGTERRRFIRIQEDFKELLPAIQSLIPEGKLELGRYKVQNKDINNPAEIEKIFAEYLDHLKSNNNSNNNFIDFSSLSPEDQIKAIDNFIEKYLDISDLNEEQKIQLLRKLYETIGIIAGSGATFEEYENNLELVKRAIQEASKYSLTRPDITQDAIIERFAKIFIPQLAEPQHNTQLQNLIEEAKEEIRREQTAKVNRAINELYYQALKEGITNPIEIKLYISDEIKEGKELDTYLLEEPLDKYIELLSRPEKRTVYIIERFAMTANRIESKLVDVEDQDKSYYRRLYIRELRQQLKQEGFSENEIKHLIKSGQMNLKDPSLSSLQALQEELLIEFGLKSPEKIPQGSILTPKKIAELADAQENDEATVEMRKLDLKIAERELKNKVPSRLSHLKQQWNVFWKRLTGPWVIYGVPLLTPTLLLALGGASFPSILAGGIPPGLILGYITHRSAAGLIRKAEIELLRAKKKAKETKFKLQQKTSIEELWKLLENYFRSTEPTVDPQTAAILNILEISDRETETIRSAKEKLMRYYETMQDQAGYILEQARRIGLGKIHLATVA